MSAGMASSWLCPWRQQQQYPQPSAGEQHLTTSDCTDTSIDNEKTASYALSWLQDLIAQKHIATWALVRQSVPDLELPRRQCLLTRSGCSSHRGCCLMALPCSLGLNLALAPLLPGSNLGCEGLQGCWGQH